MDVALRMTPLPCLIMTGATAWVQLNDALEVDGDHQVEIGLGHLLDQLAVLDLDQHVVAQHTGVVDQDVDPAVRLHDGVHPVLDGLPVGDIHLVEGGVRAQLGRAASPPRGSRRR